jgi:hypothetical protein
MLRPKVNLVVLDPGSGRTRPGAWVTFYKANTLDLSALYADDDVTGIANPVQANGLGQVAVRVDTGTYDISMTWDGAQPTVVEDVLAWSPSAAVITSPGDLIIGSPSGTAVRLAVGANGQVLFVDNGLPAWKALGSGVGLPAGATGSLLTYGAGGALTTILPGVQDQALAMAGGMPTWVSTLLPAGTTLPINQPGDLVVGATGTGVPARLAVGAPLSTLRVNAAGTGLIWDMTGRSSPGVGQCQLRIYPGNTAYLALVQFQGNQIWVADGSHTIPDTGVLLTTAGLATSVIYYIYAAWDGSALSLEASTTGPTTSGGLTHKTGDDSRTLVGMAMPVDLGSGLVWQDSPTARYVMSYFNHSLREGTNFFTAPRSTASQITPVEVHPEIRVAFLAWDYTPVILSMSGSASTPVPVSFASYLALNGVVQAGVPSNAEANQLSNISTSITKSLTPGVYTLSLYGALQEAAAAVATWHGEPGGINACKINVLISG